ncbi:LysE family translocator [Neptunomonas phycophila]|uniref:LysE family translocator n=1 Tax=Neptunomonas phycophila TaxID=1572645 RepID=A0AAW7XF12_9GAMM|nr:LysE family translocator [Neptunomonas phycophila]MDO6451968.1 LysE family translocator [Neptunomonas phycophila]
MENYLIYVGVAIATILLPGPAVMLTLNNSIQRGILKSLAGILGIALAILLVAIISATSLGIVLVSSAIAFNIIKIVGAAYLIYLGVKMFRSEATNNDLFKEQEGSFFKCFMEGFLVSVSNPKAVIFFMSIFPQFIDLTQEYSPQFILLAVTFSFLVIVIHTIYAVSASFAKSKLSSQKGSSLLNKISGGVFVSFGVGLAASSK